LGASNDRIVPISTRAPRRSAESKIGGSTTGDIETSNDQDWFAVTLTAGETYQFKSSKKKSQGRASAPCQSANYREGARLLSQERRLGDNFRLAAPGSTLRCSQTNADPLHCTGIDSKPFGYLVYSLRAPWLDGSALALLVGQVSNPPRWRQP
jgi:hypothetical protein